MDNKSEFKNGILISITIPWLYKFMKCFILLLLKIVLYIR